mmetsp:Transcript_11884/g.38872  ORF Transcript_11884/g.38872 Transcript_11884/m.38872 type:complete len:206 (-) Transcript_11884:297-914(-)
MVGVRVNVAVGKPENALPLHHIRLPLAIEDVPVGGPVNALPIFQARLPLALVDVAVGESHDAAPLLLARLPLARLLEDRLAELGVLELLGRLARRLVAARRLRHFAQIETDVRCLHRRGSLWRCWCRVGLRRGSVGVTERLQRRDDLARLCVCPHAPPLGDLLQLSPREQAQVFVLCRRQVHGCTGHACWRPDAAIPSTELRDED